MNNQEFAVWRFLVSMSDALQYLHHQHPPVIHRDLKPDNIIGKATASGHVIWKIADFGIAKMLQQNAYGVYSSARTQIGTAIYMAPEALRVRQLSNLFFSSPNLSIIHYRGPLIPPLPICGPSAQ